MAADVFRALFEEVMPWLMFFIGLAGVLIGLLIKLFTFYSEHRAKASSTGSFEGEAEDEQ